MSTETRVTMKFGGSSLRDKAAIGQVSEILEAVRAAQAAEALVVVSAMEGVTDLLERGARVAAEGDMRRFGEVSSRLRDRHLEVAAVLNGDDAGILAEELTVLLDDYDRLGRRLSDIRRTPGNLLDRAMSLGERLSARLLAAALRERGIEAQSVDATSLIVTDNRFQDAAPLPDPTRLAVKAKLEPLLGRDIVPVVTGYIGATADGEVTTLGRGGSDYSAALIGAALACDEVWIWTDVDGVMSVDPKVVPEAHPLPVLSYREVGELAYFGAKVLHPKTILPVIEVGIPLRVKNTFRPQSAGTMILPESHDGGGGVKAITAAKDVGLVTIEGRGMLGVPGTAARAFGAVARKDVNILLISQASSEQTICFAVPHSRTPEVLRALNREFKMELRRRDIDRIWVEDQMAIVTVVGAGMRTTPGVAGRVFTAVGRRGINVLAIAQGSSECSLSLVVERNRADEVMFALHELTRAHAQSLAAEDQQLTGIGKESGS